MSREYFAAYHSYLKSIEPLSDVERGRLFTALLEYSSTGAESELHGNERFLFPMMKEQIDRDSKKYSDRCKAQSENGKKGGRPRKDEKANESQKSQCFFEKAKKANAKAKAKDIPPIPPDGGCRKAADSDGFDAFYQAYPKHVGREAARKSWNKLKPDSNMQSVILKAIEAQKRTEQWQESGGKYIPMPSTWLNQMRWDDEIERKEKRNWLT